MKKNGNIPPHFIYFLENEGIQITDYKSSNFTLSESYDRIVVKFPFSISTLDIQVLFDNLDYSSPPDFVPLVDNIMINYNDIIDSWNFKDSSALYHSLNKIKEIYSKENEKKLLSMEMSESYQMIINFLNVKLNKYNHIKREERILDVLINHKIDNISHVIISYPMDIIIRCRNINRQPIINIIIPSYSNNFTMTLRLPHFVEELVIQKEEYSFSMFSEEINKFEKNIKNYFENMKLRENIVNQVIVSNIGFPLEIDTYAFNKFSIYI